MATKKEIKELLKELGQTELQMDAFWNELIETNWKVKSLSNAGKTWRDMNASVIKEIPTQKQRDLEFAERGALEEQTKKLAELEAKTKQKYYNDHFEEIIINKIDNGEKLSERELSTLVWEYEIERDNGRWTRSISSVVQLQDRCFCLNWEEGLTESQENEFYYQPYEVEKKTYEKTITVTEWIKK